MGLLAPVGSGKVRGLGVVHGSDGCWNGASRCVWIIGLGRGPGSAGSGYRSSPSLAVTTTSTRSLVGV